MLIGIHEAIPWKNSKPTSGVTIAFLFGVWLCCVSFSAGQSVSLPHANTQVTEQSAETAEDYSNLHFEFELDIGQQLSKSKVLAIAQHRPLAVVENTLLHFDVVNLETGAVIRTLTGREGRGRQSAWPFHDRHAQFADNDQLVWTLNPDAELVYELKDLQKEVEFGSNRNLPITQHEYEYKKKLAAQTTGSRLVGWSIDTGEATREVSSPNRSILRFDCFTNKQRNYIATLEGEKKLRGEYLMAHFYVGLYDADTLERISEAPLPNLGHSWYGSPYLGIRFAVRSKLLIVTRTGNGGANNVVGVNVEPLLKVKWSIPDDYHAHERWQSKWDLVTSNQILRLQSTSRIGLKQLRMLAINANTGKPQSTIPLPMVGNLKVQEFENFVHGFYHPNERRGGVQGSVKLGTPGSERKRRLRQEGTLLFDLDQQQARWLPGRFLSASNKEGELLSRIGAHDEAGRLIRRFGKPARAIPASEVFVEQLKPVGSVIDSSEQVTLLARSTELLLVNTDDAAITRRISADSLTEVAHPTTAGTQHGLELDRAVGVYSAPEDVFYVAVPLTPTKAVLKARANYTQNLLTYIRSQPSGELVTKGIEYDLELLHDHIHGNSWRLFKIGIGEPRLTQVASLAHSVCVKMLPHADGIILASVEPWHERVTLSVLDQRGELRQVWEKTNDRAKKIYTALMPTVLRGFSAWINPWTRVSLRERGDGHVLLLGIQLLTGTAATEAYVFDRRSALVETKRVDLIPAMLGDASIKYLERDKRRAEVSDRAMRDRITESPAAIDYCPESDTVVAVVNREPKRVRDKNRENVVTSSEEGKRFSYTPGIVFARLSDGEVTRYTHGQALFRGTAVFRSDGIRLPTRFAVSRGGDYCAFSFQDAQQSAVFGYLPSMQQVMVLTHHGLNAMTTDGAVIANKRRVPLSNVRAFGTLALDSPPSATTLGAKRKTTAPTPTPNVATKASTLWFFALGANRFHDPQLSNLNYCQKDVLALSNAFSRRAADDGLQYQPVLMLGPTTTSLDVQLQLEDLVKQVKPEDEVVIVFATHGMRLKRGLYLAVPNSNPAAAQSTAVGWPTIAKSILDLRTSRVLVLLDTCHAGSFNETTTSLLSEIERDLRSRPGLTIVASSKAEEPSGELRDVEHGAFTYALLKVMENHHLARQRVSNFFPVLSHKVQTLTAGRQTPILVVDNLLAEKR